ncbi:MAG: molybdate ABC transporter substrate-binding protein [Pirellulaceae bacterium]
MFLLPMAMIVGGCVSDPGGQDAAKSPRRQRLTIAAAANLMFALEDIKSAFERMHANVEIDATYGSSGNLHAQLSQGASMDVFFSADTTYPRRLVEAGLASEDAFFRYASGRIVIWVTNDSALDLNVLGIDAVTDTSVKKVAIANPRFAPYGVAAVEAMKSLEVYEATKERLVFAENVTQAAHFGESDAADVGVLALSLALSPELRHNGKYWEVPADAHQPIDQAAVILDRCKNLDAAKQLRAFVVGAEGQSILARHGYLPADES